MDIDSPTTTPLTSLTPSPYDTHNDLHPFTLPAPTKRPRAQDDPFFHEGTYEYKAAWLCLQDVESFDPDLDTTHEKKPLQTYYCHQRQCHGRSHFHSVTAYEHHYETNHRYICQSCKIPFPSQKWLDLHLAEMHDILIKIRRERGEKTYQCFVEGCDRQCSSAAKRRLHLIDKHKYPRCFNFDIVQSGVVPLMERVNDVRKHQALVASRERHRLQQQSSSSLMEVEVPVQQSRNESHTSKSAKTPTKAHVAPKDSRDHATRHAFRPRSQAAPSATATTAQASVYHSQPQPMQTDAPRWSNSSSIPQVVTSTPTSSSDMDMDVLVNTMANLMIPRSVLNRANKKK